MSQREFLELRPLQDLRHHGPYEIINWVTPEGGDGPGYELL